MLPSHTAAVMSGNPPATAAPESSKAKKPRKSRSKGLRATTGCKTCRSRHMKCDEAKPRCGPCKRSARECEYGDPTQRARPAREARPATSTRPDPIREEIAASNDRQSGYEAESKVASSISRDIPEKRESLPEPPWEQANPLEVFNITSPQSTLSSTGFGLDAPLRWFDLLAGDANANDKEFSMDLFSWGDAATGEASIAHNIAHTPAGSQPSPAFAEVPLLPPTPLDVPNSLAREPWQVAYHLQARELPIFRRFVDRIALWMDLLDPMKHFSTFVPHLALDNEGLMLSILALGARHMSIKPSPGTEDVDRNVAVEYYYKTLRYLQGAMKYESYNRSLHLHATALIVSMYEMIDGYGKGWERHLKGVFWIQRSRNIGAETPGLEGAGWWAWLRQDVWAAFRERRRVYTIHRTVKRYDEMNQYDLASKSVYLLAQCVNYSSEQDTRDSVNNLSARIHRAQALHNLLEEWHRNLTVHFAQLPWPGTTNEDDVFQPIWINPAPLAASMQMYYFARVLLLVHEPSAGGYTEFTRREKQLSEAVEAICGIAMTITDEPATITSTQCLFAAGLYTRSQDVQKRAAIMKLIDEGQIRTGWPVNSLTEELQAEWNLADTR
ncbi:uncharacterized protein PV09_00058 [Verruconis gallopava]|uniref:Zn(2)-C6 fungal-type domain-containing protein n=1 Tax=Verruconis gallopava TaxID=253628 RepID=A0A0D2BCK8_9PEZI|nr:uncharacterized protein PV09_00058 [Verruconis gallopava]KIW09114.1 hypothetical protein PV09_00058 [Verruconis gallopava]